MESPPYNPGGYFCEGDHFEDDPQPSESLPQSAIDSLLLDSTSFYNECRVFGRLKELGREDLAIKVYGYIRLDMQDKRVRQPFIDYYNRAKSGFGPGAFGENPEEDEREYVERMVHFARYHIPAFAIVKEWIPEPPRVLTFKGQRQRFVNQLPELLKNLHKIHKSGIVLQDLKPCQFIDGHLADFSHAWTIPHTYSPEGGIRPRWMFESMAAWDLNCFQEMIERERGLNEDLGLGIKIPSVRAWRNKEVVERLRPRPQAYGPFLPFVAYDIGIPKLRTHDPPFDPGLFDWRAVQKKPSKKSAGRVTKRKAATGRGKKRKAKTSKKTGSEDKGGE